MVSIGTKGLPPLRFAPPSLRVRLRSADCGLTHIHADTVLPYANEARGSQLELTDKTQRKLSEKNPLSFRVIGFFLSRLIAEIRALKVKETFQLSKTPYNYYLIKMPT